MIRVFLTTFIVFVFSHNLRADDIKIDTPELAKGFSEEYSVVVRDAETKFYQCQDVVIDFPSIRSEIGIQSVQLLIYDTNGKISTQLQVHSTSPPRNPPRPGEKLPERTEYSRDRTFLCMTNEQISKSQLIITYGYPNAMCYRDRITLHLNAFLTESSLK